MYYRGKNTKNSIHSAKKCRPGGLQSLVKKRHPTHFGQGMNYLFFTTLRTAMGMLLETALRK